VQLSVLQRDVQTCQSRRPAGNELSTDQHRNGRVTVESFNYSELLQHLKGFDAWLTSLGLTPRPNDRIHAAIEVLRRAEELIRKGRETGVYGDIQPRDWFPLIEALEAHDLFLAFQNDPSPAVAEALKRALSGPLQPIHESSKNRDGRNIWFELVLAAEWRLRGAAVCLGEPDLQLIRDGIPFLVACKRPATSESIEANLRSAIKQLQRNLDTSPFGTFGVAAISLSCTFNPGDKVFSGGVQDLGMLVKNPLDQNGPYLRSVNDSRICCVLFHVSTPAVADGVDLARATFCVLQELHPSVGSKAFMEHGREMLSTPKGC